MDNDILLLSPLDHIMPRKHSFRLFYFPASPSQDPLAIASTLRSGLESLLQTLPFLAATVKQQESCTEQRGRLAITGPSYGVDELFRVQDLSASSPSYNSLRLSGFPISAFSFEDVLTIATARGDIYSVEKPVMMAQLNFLDGGFVLGVCLHHSVLDGFACVEVMRAWATFCGGENGSVEVGPEQMDRSHLTPKKRTATLDEFPEFRCVDKGKKKTLMAILQPLSLHPPPHVAIYHFPSSTLSALKSQLSPAPPAWISTHDALSALLFSCVLTARHPSPTDPSTRVPLAINLDARTLFPSLPANYLGNAVLHSQIWASYAELRPSELNLAELALRIRGRLEEVRSRGYAEGFLAALHGVEDVSAVLAGFLGVGMFVAPWQGHGFYGIDWGVLGGGGEEGAGGESGVEGVGRRITIERMRGANEVAIREGICQIYPRVEGDEGGLEVLIGLGAEAEERLRGMDFWRRWARWRCD